MKQQPPCDDKSLLMAYLYGECDEDERRRMDRHIADCASCATELEQLRGVRGALREWTPPEPAFGFRLVREEVTDGRTAAHAGAPSNVAAFPTKTARWGAGRGMRVPAWAQLAAAVLVLAVGAAIANLNVHVGSDGVTVRTGWQRGPVVQAERVPAPPSTATPTAVAPASVGAAPWRADLAALEVRLRGQISAIPVAAPTTTAAPEERAALLRHVQTLVDDMGRRQQRDYDRQLAERFLQFAHDVNSQRVADLRLIQQGLGQMDVRTTSEVAQLRQAFLRVANVQQMK